MASYKAIKNTFKTSETLSKCPYAYTVNAPSQGWGRRLDVFFFVLEIDGFLSFAMNKNFNISSYNLVT